MTTKELTPLEALKEYRKQNVCGVNVYADEYLDIIEKELKALEIIKEKRVNVRALLKCWHRADGLLIYNSQCDNDSEMESKELTQEEYYLLKEML